MSECSDRHRNRQHVERLLGLHASDRGTTGQMATQPVLRGQQQLLLICHHFFEVTKNLDPKFTDINAIVV